MSGVNMSLDDIISQNKKSKSGRTVGGFRSDGVPKPSELLSTGKSGAVRNFGRFSDRTPSGKWKHDKFHEVNGPRVGGARVIGGAGSTKKVRVNLSNLGPNVVSADLEELFADYDVDTATVHFNEHGESLGTGDVYLKKKDAAQMFEDFKGVSLDGQLIKMVIVDGSVITNGTTIQSRLQFNRSPRQIGRGVGKKYRERRNGGVSNFLDRTVGFKKGFGQNKRDGKLGRGKREKKPQKTVDQLDAELESYMSKGKDMEI